MLHPIYFLPTLYTDTDMSIFGMVIVLAFHYVYFKWVLPPRFRKARNNMKVGMNFP